MFRETMSAVARSSWFPMVCAFAMGSALACGSPEGRRSAQTTAVEHSSQNPESGKAPAAQAPGKVVVEKFSSASLGVEKDYWVYLPGGYDKGEQRYPVIYMLHGLGGRENNWVKHMGLDKAADSVDLQAIVVMPDGDDSFYTNQVAKADYEACLKGARFGGKTSHMEHYCVREAQYEDYITKDLIAEIDGKFRTLPKREFRAIGGLSMGGYGALMLAMRNPSLYSSIASHSGVDAILYGGPYPYKSGEVQLVDEPKKTIARLGEIGSIWKKAWGEELANWQKHDPAFLAKDLVDGIFSIYLDCGSEDEFGLQNHATYLHEILQERGVTHFFEILPGRHNLAFWSERIDESLRFHAAHFEREKNLD